MIKTILGTIGLVCFILGIILLFVGIVIMLECDNIIVLCIAFVTFISGSIMGCIDYNQIEEFDVESVEIAKSEDEEYYIFLIEIKNNQFLRVILSKSEAELYYKNDKFYISKDKLNDLKQ